MRRQSYQEVRTVILEFLDTDVFNLSIAHCKTFLTPLIDSWDIDLTTFELRVRMNRRLSGIAEVQFHFVERQMAAGDRAEPGFREFLDLPELSANATEDELLFLRGLNFHRQRPTALFYYRQLQNLRDPLNFSGSSMLGARKRREGSDHQRSTQLNSRKRALRRWTRNALGAADRQD